MVTMSSESNNNKTNIPKPADYDQLTNRMNMALSRRSAMMSSLRGPQHATKSSSSSRSSAGTKDKQQKQQPSITTTTTTTKPSTSFSSLLSSSTGPAKSNPISSSSSSKKQNNNTTTRGDNNDDVLDHLGSYNQGLGFANKTTDRGSRDDKDDAAAVRDLRGKLLGKRAREQKDEAAAAKPRNAKKARGRKVADSEHDSDEEEGRSSAVAKKGRGKK